MISREIARKNFAALRLRRAAGAIATFTEMMTRKRDFRRNS
jgi:hypothetical protein